MTQGHSCLSIASDATALAMTHPQEEEQFAGPTDWNTVFFRELELGKKMFSSPGTLQSLLRDTRTQFST